jgi:hypothetical protein
MKPGPDSVGHLAFGLKRENPAAYAPSNPVSTFTAFTPTSATA